MGDLRRIVGELEALRQTVARAHDANMADAAALLRERTQLAADLQQLGELQAGVSAARAELERDLAALRAEQERVAALEERLAWASRVVHRIAAEWATLGALLFMLGFGCGCLAVVLGGGGS